MLCNSPIVWQTTLVYAILLDVRLGRLLPFECTLIAIVMHSCQVREGFFLRITQLGNCPDYRGRRTQRQKPVIFLDLGPLIQDHPVVISVCCRPHSLPLARHST